MNLDITVEHYDYGHMDIIMTFGGEHFSIKHSFTMSTTKDCTKINDLEQAILQLESGEFEYLELSMLNAVIDITKEGDLLIIKPTPYDSSNDEIDISLSYQKYAPNFVSFLKAMVEEIKMDNGMENDEEDEENEEGIN